uniref:Uncharacterized protein n=1 Tax=Anguilla anguilla TaxID=7936 RepID=A0A0E9W4I2_ANGAN
MQDANKNTALHLACNKGHETSALLILEKITDRNLINSTNAALQTCVPIVRGLYFHVFFGVFVMLFSLTYFECC